MPIDVCGYTIYNKSMKRGGEPLRASDRGREPRKGNQTMKHANIILAKMASLVGTGAEHDESFPFTWLGMRLCGEALGRSPYVRIEVEFAVDDQALPIPRYGYGHTVDTAYRNAEEDIWSDMYREPGPISRVTVSVLTPRDNSVDYVPMYSVPLAEPLAWEELRRRSRGPVTGEALLQVMYKAYCEEQGYIAVDVVDVEAINRRAHANQMWVSRHYGRPA